MQRCSRRFGAAGGGVRIFIGRRSRLVFGPAGSRSPPAEPHTHTHTHTHTHRFPSVPSTSFAFLELSSACCHRNSSVSPERLALGFAPWCIFSCWFSSSNTSLQIQRFRSSDEITSSWETYSSFYGSSLRRRKEKDTSTRLTTFSWALASSEKTLM